MICLFALQSRAWGFNWPCCDRDKKLYNHSYQLKAMRRYYKFELVPVSIMVDGGRQTAYTINITGSKQNVTASKQYARQQYETMQHGVVTSVDIAGDVTAQQPSEQEELAEAEASWWCSTCLFHSFAHAVLDCRILK